MHRIVNLAWFFAALSVCSYASDGGRGSRLSSLPVAARSRVLAALSQDMTWQQRAELTASDEVNTDEFGITVAIDGNTLVVGAPWATIGANKGQGAAYVFVKPKSGWQNMTQTAKLTASDGQGDANFGWSVAISGDTVLVGTLDWGVGGGYAFVKPARGWRTRTETVKLPNAKGCFAVAISGDTAVCGWSTALVYVKPKSGWKSIQDYDAELIGSDSGGFGYPSVSINWDTVVVGDPLFYGDQGAAYVFVKPKGGWNITSNSRRVITQTAELKAPDGYTGSVFGSSVSICGNTLAVGEPGSLNGGEPSGAVNIFVANADWTVVSLTARLASPTEDASGFGVSVALRGRTLVVGADFAVPTGATYLYLKPPGGWVSTGTYYAMLTPSDGQAWDGFGYSVAISGETILVGEFPTNGRPGAAYAFEP